LSGALLTLPALLHLVGRRIGYARATALGQRAES
jgi:hypothetical protein